jgi:hypothetical protein
MATQYTAGLTTGEVLTAATMNSIGAAWESYTPTLTQLGTVTNTITYSKYTRINKLCIYNVRLEVTGAGTTNNAITVTLPLTCASPVVTRVGTGSFYDASAAIVYNGTAQLITTTTVGILPDAVNNFAGITPNVPLAANDQISFCLAYEVA